MPDLEPITRLEEYLSKLAGDDVAVPEPITRVEKFLAYIAGETDSKPTPITRIEKFLDAIGQGGGGGGGETVIVPEQTVETTEYGGAYFGNLVGDITINIGEEYTATINGTSYTVTAQDAEGQTYLGDFELSDPPFFIADDDGTWVVGMPTSGAVTVKVTQSGGASATIIEKNITANGTYNASSDSADGYNPVNVSVPNSYSAGDEGKVVSSGALVTQTAATYTANSVYDTTLIDEVTVNVSGGASPFTLLHSEEVVVNTVSTTATTVATLSYSSLGTLGLKDGLMAVVYDKAGPRNGYFYYWQTSKAAYGNISATNSVGVDSNGAKTVNALNAYGVYFSNIGSTSATLSARYNSGIGAIDGTYVCDIYKFDLSSFL